MVGGLLLPGNTRPTFGRKREKEREREREREMMGNVQSVKAQAQFVPESYPVRVVQHVGERYDGLYRYHRHHLHMRTYIEVIRHLSFFFYNLVIFFRNNPPCVFGLPIPTFFRILLIAKPSGVGKYMTETAP